MASVFLTVRSLCAAARRSLRFMFGWPFRGNGKAQRLLWLKYLGVESARHADASFQSERMLVSIWENWTESYFTISCKFC